MVDIHNYRGQLERQIALAKEEKDISEPNREMIIKFKDYLLSEGIGFAKITRYILDIRKYCKLLKKDITEAKKEDLRKIISELNTTELGEESKKGFKIMLRKLYRFIKGIEEKGVYPDEVKWISIAIPKSKGKLPEELLTEEEIKSLLANSRTSRDRAMIACLAESGCRVGEVGGMQIKHVSFETYGARITVQGKTGMRKILIINSAPYIQEWINQHPDNNNPDAFLWYNYQNKKFLCYARILQTIKRIAKRAGIKKRIHPHLFRHSRATQLASVMSEAQMKNYLGWEQSSKMAAIYVHMSGKDTDEALLRANGIITEKEKEEPKLKPSKCLRCRMVNPVTNKFCNTCGFVLDEREALDILRKESERERMDNLLSQVMQDKEVLTFITQRIKEVSVASLVTPKGLNK